MILWSESLSWAVFALDVLTPPLFPKMEAFVTEAFTLLGVGLLFIGLRTYVRVTTVGWKGLQADDYLMWVAAVCVSPVLLLPS